MSCNSTRTVWYKINKFHLFICTRLINSYEILILEDLNRAYFIFFCYLKDIR